MRMDGTALDVRRMPRRIAVALAVVAALLVAVAAMAHAAARAHAAGATASWSGPAIDLRMNEKTEVNGNSYKLGNATVSGSGSAYVVVGVTGGWFETNKRSIGEGDDLSSGTVMSAALSADGAFISGRDADGYGNGEANARYRFIEFGPNGRGRSEDSENISAEQLQAYLRGLMFHVEEGMPQTVWVSAWSQTPQAVCTHEKCKNGRNGYGDNGGGLNSKVHLFGGHAYTFVGEADIDFEQAHHAARSTMFLGRSGHLMTIESESEHNLIYKLCKDRNTSGTGWIGGQRVLSGSESSHVSNWYWVAGPNAGTKFWSGQHEVPGVFAKWANGQPSPVLDACCVQYGWTSGDDDSGAWNALTSSGHHARSAEGSNANSQLTTGQHIRGFFVEFEDFDPSVIGQVSGTVTKVAVTTDLRDVTSSNMASSMLSGTEYSTTLTSADGRDLDVASIAVTVGGSSLSQDANGFTLSVKPDKRTAELKIPAHRVTGDVHVTAKANRLVTLMDMWTDLVLAKVQVANGGTLDKAVFDAKIETRAGYAHTGYAKDGVEWNFGTQVHDDMTLRPSFTLNPPMVTIWPHAPRLEHRGAMVMLHASSRIDGVPAATFTYQWSKDGVALPGGANGVLAVREAGLYTVTAMATDPATNLMSQGHASVTVKPPHQRTVTLQGRNGFSWLTKRFTVTNGDKLDRNDVDEKAAWPGYTVVRYTTADGADWLFETEVRADLTLHPHHRMIAPVVTATADPSKLVSVGDKSMLDAQVSTSVANAKITYQWSKGDKPIVGATGRTHEAGESGTYMVEATVTDPRTGMSATGKASVTVDAPDMHTVTVAERDGSKIYLTVKVPNGGLLGADRVSGISRDGYTLTGWVKADGMPFDPTKDRITKPETISPLWKAVAKPKPAKPAKPAITMLVDTGSSIAVSAVTSALLIAIAAALAMLRRRKR